MTHVHHLADLPSIAFTHIIDGKVKQAKMKLRPCSSKMTIYEPLDSNVRKAVVIVKTPHNHPVYLHSKPHQSEISAVKSVLSASGGAVTASELRTG
jgi:hypothetical protein